MPGSWLHPDLLFDGRTLAPGALKVHDGRIVAVAPAPSDASPVERLAGQALFPGFVNAHSHAFQRGLRGFVQHGVGEDSFWTWREQMYGLATTLPPEGVHALSALAFLEMVRAGFTTVGEFHYLHHQPDGTPYDDPDELAWAVISAAERVGLRIVLLRVAYARAGFGVDPNPRQRRFYDRDPAAVLAAVERIAARGVRVGIAPHSTRACPADWLRALAAWPGTVHAHVDEQPAEIEASLREHGVRPVHVFERAGLLGPRFSAVHLTWPDDAEVAALRAAGGRVVACPTTELDLGDGFLPLERLDGIPVAVGTDSHARIDPFAEIAALELHLRARLGRRNVLPHGGPDGLAARLVQAGTVEGARALGLEDVGTLAVGQRADLVAVRLGVEVAAARALPALVFAGHPGLVQQVWVGGRALLAGGEHPAAAAIRAEAGAWV